ncbi:MAG: AMP-binding protein, partial [Armatimonadota bacterium]|nr:AMP-binding protein [Armatimonadota bacterium]
VVILRGGKELPLYANLLEADAPPAIVLPATDQVSLPLRAGDCTWTEFLEAEKEEQFGGGGPPCPPWRAAPRCFEPVAPTAGTEAGPHQVFPEKGFEPVPREPSDHLNILFSSGTTGEPKTIPWTHTTPIKCAADAHFHQNVQPGDVLVWPTNLGWMMGPWLIFASLINRATMGLYYGAPTGREFCRFVQDARVTMLGVVPSLVKTWRNADCVQGLDWSAIKVFSSTGECSNAEDMRWLMAQASGRPVIEYCGGTEIGGGYITGTVTRPCVPGTFNTPALGLDFVVLDDAARPAPEGELFIVPPSIGLSTTLLNKGHHETYFADTPRGPHGETLRRHGDWMEELPGGYWRAHGRADDTMNLGGIKVSCVEIEQALQSVPEVTETAAIAVSPGGGPSRLVVYAVCSAAQVMSTEELLAAMQQAIKRDLNPLFKIHDLVLIDALPRTASHKVMRRVLRDQYISQTQ